MTRLNFPGACDLHHLFINNLDLVRARMVLSLALQLLLCGFAASTPVSKFILKFLTCLYIVISFWISSIHAHNLISPVQADWISDHSF